MCEYVLTSAPRCFAARAAAGKKALASPEGQRYEQSWGEVMGNVLHACIPIGSSNPANLGRFTFVANISAAGEVFSVEVEPTNRGIAVLCRAFR